MSLNRTCPICGGAAARAFWHDRSTPYRAVRCTSCGAIWSDLSEAQYAAAQHNVWNEEELAQDVDLFYRVQRERVHLEFLEVAGGLVPGRRVLDIGCGLGVFLERAAQAGWEPHGIDTSPEWVASARARVGEEAIQLGIFQESPLADEQFDLITLWDVIEHVWDPVPLLAAAARCLAPGGVLFVRTPNIRYVAPVYQARRALLRENIDLGVTNHVIHFSAGSLGRALTAAGFGRRDWRTLAPPQVPVAKLGAVGRASVGVKNAIAGTSDAASRTVGAAGTVGSDLDVFAWATS